MVSAAALSKQVLPARRPELIVRSVGEKGECVVKDPKNGTYFQLGEQEHFLLTKLDGQRRVTEICEEFSQRFHEPLSEEEVLEFVELARGRGLLLPMESGSRDGTLGPESQASATARTARVPPPATFGQDAIGLPQQSILYWRKKLFDPDRLFAWMEPKLRFFWTRAFLAISAGAIVLAVAVLWANSERVATNFADAVRWETVAWLWLVLVLVTTGHEFAHGLTCKHYGGEVREVGFLLMFLMPCFYCNVSDAWLFGEKSKRLWVTFAGGYFELFLWAIAVLCWRLTMPDTLVNYLAFIVMSVCGIKTLFNFNPLIKLDGYYLLSDWLEVPNLRPRAVRHFKAQFRRLLWGAPRSDEEAPSRFLLGFGLTSWLYSVTLLSLMVIALFQFAWRQWSWVGATAVAVVALVSARGLFRGFADGEVHRMISKRRKRALLWLAGVAGVAAVLWGAQMNDRASGTFHVRPLTRAELRAPVAGFLAEVFFDEGDRISSDALVARLEVPHLKSRIAQKNAEVREARAKLALLEQGARPEEVLEQRHRVERARDWRDLAKKDLTHARQALREELARLDKQIAQYGVELDTAKDALERAWKLRGKAVVTEERFQEAERRFQVAQAQLAQAQFEKRHREALGTREAIAGLDAEAELARRVKDLADAEGTLTLMEAGTRPEEIEAEQARLNRLQEEVRHLEEQQRKQAVTSPVVGIVTTARLKEKIGQYLQEGDLVCVVEEPESLEVEIDVAEQDTARIRVGQEVELKARALPFETFTAKVDRIAPEAGRGDVQSTLTVYCRLEHVSAGLRPEMSGYARIYTGRKPVGEILLLRALRFLRTEFWW